MRVETGSCSVRANRLAAVAGALLLGTAAMPAGAQSPDFAGRCYSMTGPAQVDACINALHYEPRNPELLRRLGDAMLATNRPGGAYDAYTDALMMRPEMVEARAGRDEAIRQIAGRAQPPATAVYVPQPQTYVPVQPMPPPATASPVAYGPFDGRWSGTFEPRGQRFQVAANVVGGHLRLFYEDSTDRVTLEGTVDNAGYFSGKGLFKDKNRSAGDGGDPVAISGRFMENRFDGTGSAGTKAVTMRLNRDW
ncbi:MAG: hypothetical protein L6R19_18470 [Alphaproteobacteria bacterium]|nr:hypothetical protein [Alphaproteobacteria bacterium]